MGVVLRGNPFCREYIDVRLATSGVALLAMTGIYFVGNSKNAADEFSEEGRSAGGGLRNGDLLILKSAKATILPTASCDPENLSPRGFNPHSRLFLLAARQSVQAPSALAPQRRLALPFVGKR